MFREMGISRSQASGNDIYSKDLASSGLGLSRVIKLVRFDLVCCYKGIDIYGIIFTVCLLTYPLPHSITTC